MREPDAVQKLKTIGFDPIVKNTAETTEYFKSEVATWARMVKAVGITID
jgi:tripartite-type tricarboxylate transporter receptor subunit TctC